jgi:hypothetical protein
MACLSLCPRRTTVFDTCYQEDVCPYNADGARLAVYDGTAYSHGSRQQVRPARVWLRVAAVRSARVLPAFALVLALLLDASCCPGRQLLSWSWRCCLMPEP